MKFNILKSRFLLFVFVAILSTFVSFSSLANSDNPSYVDRILEVNPGSSNADFIDKDYLSENIAGDPYYAVLDFLFHGQITKSLTQLGIPDLKAPTNNSQPFLLTAVQIAWIIAGIISFYLFAKITIKTTFEISASGDTESEQSKFHFWDFGRYMFIFLLYPMEIQVGDETSYVPLIYIVMSIAIALSIILVTILTSLFRVTELPMPLEPSTPIMNSTTLYNSSEYLDGLNKTIVLHRDALSEKFIARTSSPSSQTTTSFHPIFGYSAALAKHYLADASQQFINYSDHKNNASFDKITYDNEILVLKLINNIVQNKIINFNMCQKKLFSGSLEHLPFKGSVMATDFPKKVYGKRGVDSGSPTFNEFYSLNVGDMAKKINIKSIINDCKTKHLLPKLHDRELDKIPLFPVNNNSYATTKDLTTSSSSQSLYPSPRKAVSNLLKIVNQHLNGYKNDEKADPGLLNPDAFPFASYIVHGTKKQLLDKYSIDFSTTENKFIYTGFRSSEAPQPDSNGSVGSSTTTEKYILPPGFGFYNSSELEKTKSGFNTWSKYAFGYFVKLSAKDNVHFQKSITEGKEFCPQPSPNNNSKVDIIPPYNPDIEKSSKILNSAFERFDVRALDVSQVITTTLLTRFAQLLIASELEKTQSSMKDKNLKLNAKICKASTYPISELDPSNSGSMASDLFSLADTMIVIKSALTTNDLRISGVGDKEKYRTTGAALADTFFGFLKTPIFLTATLKLFLVATYLFAIFILLANTVKNIVIAPMWISTLTKQSDIEGVSQDQTKGFKELLYIVLYPSALMVTVSIILFIIPVVTSILYQILMTDNTFVFVELSRFMHSLSSFHAEYILTVIKTIVFIIAVFFVNMRLFRWMFSMPYKILKAIGVETSMQNKQSMEEMFSMRV
jgi:hypothetical protein